MSQEFKRAAVGTAIDRALTAREAISLLRENAYDRVYLDDDLDDDPAVRRMDDYESGQVVADWLAENAAGREGCLFIIHSRCKSGATAMQDTLQPARLQVVLGDWTWREDSPRSR
jgi:ABC-type sugar transport system substrate-binding protein